MGSVKASALLAEPRPAGPSQNNVYETKFPRRQPIRDAILAFMTGPRSAGQIAEHIERPVPTATGHLRAMIRLGLVRRIAFGTYAPAAYTGPGDRIPQRRSKSSKELRHQVREFLDTFASVQGLHLRTGKSESSIRIALPDLWFSGLLEGNEVTGYRLVQRKRRQ
jgi:hypothetical protein